MFYIKASDRDTYLYADGGTNAGNKLTMHACPKESDYPNCQWSVEPASRWWYCIKSSDQRTYIHADGGTQAGNALTMHVSPHASWSNCLVAQGSLWQCLSSSFDLPAEAQW